MAKRTRRPVRPAGVALRAVLYLRCSTDEQARDGHGLDAQRTALLAEAERRGWDVVDVVSDEGVSGTRHFGTRPGGGRVLQLLEDGAADLVASSKLDRMCRSFGDAGTLLEQSKRQGWRVVWCDIGVDTSTPGGELMAGVVASSAQYERSMASQRTRDGLAAARAKGIRLGRPQQLPLDVVARIVDERRAGQSLPGIARGLMADGVPTARGGATWHPSTVAAVLESQAAAAIA
jgi:DNA invertase Pin-like site-specific DNA recombinase